MIDRDKIFQGLIDRVKLSIDESKSYLDGLIDARNNDTKSSAGDKYETGRSMAQQEIDRGEENLHQLKVQLNELQRLSKKKLSTICEQGSIVILDDVVFLLGPAIGKLELDTYTVLSISMGSPFGKLLSGKKEGEIVLFRGKDALLKKVI